MLKRRIAAWIVLLVVLGAAVAAWWLARPGDLTVRSTPSPTLLPAGSRAPWTGTVVHVSDGDTLDVRGPSGRVRVRLLGIDSPELSHDGLPAACGAQASKEALAGLVLDHEVTVVPDSVGDTSDRFGRRLAYVQLGTTDVALHQLASGFVEAWAPSSAVVPTRLPDYRRAQTVAQQSKAGSWAACGRLGR